MKIGKLYVITFETIKLSGKETNINVGRNESVFDI